VPDEEGPGTDDEFDRLLDMFFDLFRARPDAKERADGIVEQEYGEVLHQFAHRIMILGVIDISRCDISTPVLGVVFAAGYVRRAIEDAAGQAQDMEGQAPDIELTSSGPAMSMDAIRQLMGQTGEEDGEEVQPEG
jgi:hypothetical protein